jgi:nicotinamide mononucleotide transporter
MSKLKAYEEPNRKVRTVEKILLVLCAAGTVISYLSGSRQLQEDVGSLTYEGTLEMSRNPGEEDYDEDSTVCEVTYRNGDAYLVVSYTYEEYTQLESTEITAYVYETENGKTLYFDHADPSQQEIQKTYQTMTANAAVPVFNLGTSLAILFFSLLVMTCFGKMFTTYEKSWFLSIMVLATIVAVRFPEESANGVNGIVIMFLYLLDTFLNILCELLISKQSRYNFLVSVAVEITEIVMCLVLMYRFATMVTTLFFWLPIDILSYLNWSKHKDEESQEITAVRRLKGYQEVLTIAGILAWTLIVGWFLSGLDIQTDFFHGNVQLETVINYIDACASAVGVANGLFIFFRLREQWIAWYICAGLEAVINILSGQYVLLVLKLGYFTNTTYGYIKWSRYIKSHKEEKGSIL